MDRIDLILKISNITYQIGTIVPDPIGHLYYHFCYSSTTRQHLNIHTHKLTGRLDHISWHSSGHVHLKPNKSSPIYEYRFADNTFLPKDEMSITPLLIDSIYKASSTADIPLPIYVPSQTELPVLIDIPINSDALSLILFLVPKCRTLNENLHSLWLNTHMKYTFLNDILIEKDSCGLISCWDKFSLLWLISPISLVVPPFLTPERNTERAFAYYDLNLHLKNAILTALP